LLKRRFLISQYACPGTILDSTTQEQQRPLEAWTFYHLAQARPSSNVI
jgi:hypothetical protein